MKTDHIDDTRGRKIGGNYFILVYNRNSNKTLIEHLEKFNFDDYWCFKSSNTPFIIKTFDEFKEFKWSGYIFFKKDLYSLKDIENWLKWMKLNKISLKFLNKPFPNISFDKIKIIDEV